MNSAFVLAGYPAGSAMVCSLVSAWVMSAILPVVGMMRTGSAATNPTSFSANSAASRQAAYDLAQIHLHAENLRHGLHGEKVLALVAYHPEHVRDHVLPRAVEDAAEREQACLVGLRHEGVPQVGKQVEHEQTVHRVDLH